MAFYEWLTDHEEVVVESVRYAVPPFALTTCELSISIGRACFRTGQQWISLDTTSTIDLLLHFTPRLRSSSKIPASFLVVSPLPTTSRYCCVRAVIASAPPTSRGPSLASRTQTLIPSCRASNADNKPVGPATRVRILVLLSMNQHLPPTITNSTSSIGLRDSEYASPT